MKLGLEGVDWIHMALGVDTQRALVDTVVNFRCSIKGAEFLDYLSIVLASQQVFSMQSKKKTEEDAGMTFRTVPAS
jgi:hypothetical protein